MKKILNILIFQFLLSIISALLLSQMSWLGRVGISLFQKDYAILKDPIQSAPTIFGIQFLVIVILHLFYVYSKRKLAKWICVLIFLLAILGLLYTIYDFRETFSHRILKAKFHYGFYLIWIGMMISSVYYFILPKKSVLNIVEETNLQESIEDIHSDEQ